MSVINKYPDDLIEKAARAICKFYGYDPDEQISGDYLIGYTNAEREDYLIKTGGKMPMVMAFVPRWCANRQLAVEELGRRELANVLDDLLAEQRRLTFVFNPEIPED